MAAQSRNKDLKTAQIGAPLHPLTGAVQDMWVRDQSATAAEIHRRMERTYGTRCISSRKVQDIVRELKQHSVGENRPRFVRAEWHPWESQQITSEELDFLLRLKLVKRACFRAPLHEHEARIAVRIRAAVDGLDPVLQFMLVQEYGYREEVRLIMGEGVPKTEDLDDILALKPWMSENSEIWDQARALGLGPKPGFYFGELPYMDDPEKLDPFYWVRDSLLPSDETRDWVNGRSGLAWRELVLIGLTRLVKEYEYMGLEPPRDTYPRLAHRVPEEYEAQLQRAIDTERTS